MSALILAAIVLMTSMQSGPQAELETIVRDNMSNVEDAKQAVARTPAEWAALWRLHAGDQPAPKIDFTKRTVVAVFLGTRPSAGYAVEVSGTKPAGKTLIVEWSEHTPKPGNVSAQVMTSPSHLVSIPKFDGEITFQKVGP
jgi:hypothetical protein